MLTLDEVRDALGATEPDYPRLASEFGSDAIPILGQLVVSGDRRVAAKAVYLGALLGDAGCVQAAARQGSEFLRVAAAGAAGDLEDSTAAALLRMLSNDPNPLVQGVVRRYAAMPRRPPGGPDS